MENGLDSIRQTSERLSSLGGIAWFLAWGELARDLIDLNLNTIDQEPPFGVSINSLFGGEEPGCPKPPPPGRTEGAGRWVPKIRRHGFPKAQVEVTYTSPKRDPEGRNHLVG